MLKSDRNYSHLLCSFYVLGGTMLSAFYGLSPLKITTVLSRGRYFFHPLFTGKEMQDQRGGAPCPGSHSQEVSELLCWRQKRVPGLHWLNPILTLRVAPVLSFGTL